VRLGPEGRRRLGLRVLTALAALGTTGLLLALLLVGRDGLPAGPTLARATLAGGDPVPQTDASVPARAVTMIGSSPGEAPGETWGVGTTGRESVLVTYNGLAGWSLGPGFVSSEGAPLKGFRLADPEAFRYPNPSPLAGSLTSSGSGALLGSVTSSEGATKSTTQMLLARNPGGAFRQVPLPTSGAAALSGGERLFGVDRAPLVAALDEGGSPARAGALVVPVDEETSVDRSVLHWNGEIWTREVIEIPSSSTDRFEVVAISATSPENAWLLARLSSTSHLVDSVALFRRDVRGGGEPAVWRAVAPRPGGEPGEAVSFEVAGEEHSFTEPGGQAQILAATGEGVWLNGRSEDDASTVLFFKPEGDDAGHVQVSWCKLPASAPAEAKGCERTLPEALPSGPSRMFAWSNSGTPEGLGGLVLTGLADGVSLRLEGTEIKPFYSLGGAAGAAFGAAFSSPSEGWLGKDGLPVHFTTSPAPSRLTPWPTPFRYALLALASEPGAPVGELASEALAVGDQGEVARYIPGEGWEPESLLSAGGERQTPRLRAVAWPTPSRAYAVGDLGQMWLWRSETGLWEPDPATPLNFRANLLDVAFDPEEPSRGYAVGQGGTLLSYGKTWTQEPAEDLPSAVVGANFTSVAFAGSEAIVAYRKLKQDGESAYEGGVIVNEGSGWHIDTGAATALGANTPWAVAGLPDGGAAITAFGDEGGEVYERQTATAGWQATTPVPDGDNPNSVALFREGGALRAVVSGSAPETIDAESEPSPPPGFPPNLELPYPINANAESGVLRQTAGGWSDEEHELNDAKEPPGSYAFYDTPYQPDPVAAVLINPSGTEGWAVGGAVNNLHPILDTADIDRYPADGVPPVGVGTAPFTVEGKLHLALPSGRGEEAAPITASAQRATFAIGGNAECAAPCATRSQTRIGPDVWLSAALQRAGQIPGVRAFLYTGPRVTTGATAGPAELPVPHKLELGRYAEVLAGSPLHVYAAAGPTDLDEFGSETGFKEAFSSFAEPFGRATPPSLLPRAGDSQPTCSAATNGCTAAYAFISEAERGRSVRVIVLDTTAAMASEQLAWLEGQLADAKAEVQPAIVMGQADLGKEIAEGNGAAAAAAQTMAEGGASAYFFDSPEKNVRRTIPTAAGAVPSFGSGTLGYVDYQAEEAGGFIGASGFLLAQVNFEKWDHSTNVAEVNVTLEPNVGELALEAVDGTLLRRSQAALFDGLARRPRSGNRAHNKSVEFAETSPYIPIPSRCIGTDCAEGIFPEYTFSSSKENVGQFVEQNEASAESHAVLLGPNGKPIPEPHSGLFCAYFPGTTIVTISAGGLSYSLPVTVQAGSVRQPCGTVPQPAKPAAAATASAALPPAPAPSPAGPAPASFPPLVPVPPAPAPAHTLPPPGPVAHETPPPFFVQPVLPFLAPALVPPPLPAPANPTPPSGTSAVTSPVEAAQKEEDPEAAPESVSAEAVAYRQSEHEPAPVYLLGIIVLAAFAGASLRGRPRGSRGVAIAPATISTLRSQRRLSRERRR
jgi:hypothetical protein